MAPSQMLFREQHGDSLAGPLSWRYDASTSNQRIEAYFICFIRYLPGAVAIDRHRKQYHSVEPYIGGALVKYNDNTGGVNDSVGSSALIAGAFSHYSYEWSEKTLIVVDIQGIIYIY